jgi:Arc/MetJ family transcription regulator
MMRTTIDIDKDLLEEAGRIAGVTSPSVTVKTALEEYIRQDRIKRLIESLGTWDLDLDDWYEYRHQERT